MTFVVPFDGSELSRAALRRAAEFGRALDRDVVAVTVIPVGNAEYAREHGWLGPAEAFDLETVRDRVAEQVAEIAPDAGFQQLTAGRFPTEGAIARKLRTFTRENDASMVFVGSENAGSMVTSLSSVGGAVAAEETYDVAIVRNPTRSEDD